MRINYFKFWDNFDKQVPINIMEIGEEICENNYCISRLNSQIYAMEFIISGDHKISINGKEYINRPGDIILLSKYSDHTYGYYKENCKKIWFIFDGALVPSLISSYIYNDEYVFNCPDLQDDFLAIISYSKQHKNDYNLLKNYIVLALHKILIKINYIIDKPHRQSLPEQIKDFINHNLNQPFSLNSISNNFNYSKNYIINIFKNNFGITPNKYYINRKIEIACLYLKNTNFAIKDISDLTGFVDQHYFCNTFTRLLNITPTQFRRNCIFNLSK